MKNLLLVLAMSGSLFAAPIGLFNTGVDGGGTPLVGADLVNGPNILDTHWSLVSGPGTVNGFVTDFQGAYFSEVGLNGRWIAPAFIDGQNAPVVLQNSGTYVLEQIFSLTGLLVNTATLSGSFAADNCATITLNSTVLATTGGACLGSGNPTSNFQSLTAFSAASGAFVAGQNVLRITLLNENSPSGVLVANLQGSADIDTTVPEPSTYALIGSALVALALRKRKA